MGENGGTPRNAACTPQRRPHGTETAEDSRCLLLPTFLRPEGRAPVRARLSPARRRTVRTPRRRGEDTVPCQVGRARSAAFTPQRRPHGTEAAEDSTPLSLATFLRRERRAPSQTSPSPSPRAARAGRGELLIHHVPTMRDEHLLSPALSAVPNGGEGDGGARLSPARRRALRTPRRRGEDTAPYQTAPRPQRRDGLNPNPNHRHQKL